MRSDLHPIVGVLLRDPVGGWVEVQDDPRILGARVVHVGGTGRRPGRGVEGGVGYLGAGDAVDSKEALAARQLAPSRQVPLPARVEHPPGLHDAGAVAVAPERVVVQIDLSAGGRRLPHGVEHGGRDPGQLDLQATFVGTDAEHHLEL